MPLSPPQAPPSAAQSQGTLHEMVQVTPRGRRRHRLEETSPGGTTRVDEYFSPAGAQGQQQQRQPRKECFRRLAAAKRAAAAERTEAERAEAEREVSEAPRSSPALVLPLLRVFRKTGRDAGDRVTHGVAIARLAMSECSGLPLPGGRGSASLPHMLHVRQGSCAWDTAAQSLKLCMTCSELESVMMLVDSCMNHGS